MTILDSKVAVEHVTSWLVSQLTGAGLKSCVVGVSGGIDSAVTVAIAARAAAELGGVCVGVMMPCQSSNDSQVRAAEVIERVTASGFPVKKAYVDLEGAFSCIVSQYQLFDVDTKTARFCYGALRSCLRAPTLDYVAKCNGALVVGTGNRDEDEIFRYYQKRGDGAVDNNPIVCFHKSEVYELARYLELPDSVIKATPSADLWGPDSGQSDEAELGLTYDEIEWITREDDEYGLIFDVEADFMSFEDSVSQAQIARRAPYTEREMEIIHRAARASKETAHKAAPPPGPYRANLIHVGAVI